MTWLTRRPLGILLGCTALALGGMVPGCANDTTDSDVGHNTEVAKSKWAVDMAKVDVAYGTSSAFFIGMQPAEAALPLEQLQAVAAQVAEATKQGALAQGATPEQAEQAAAAAAAKVTGPIWDQTFAKNPDGTAHVDTGDDIALIDRDGKGIDPPGYINIIPMLADTDPTEQVHIEEFLEDGDVLVYFHPEYIGNPKDMMERRSSHVAMHYEHETDSGQKIVHHIDNPNSYGPRYNHSPRKHMPFHVFRFQPRADKTFSTNAGAATTADIEGVSFTPGQSAAVIELVNTASLEQLDVELGLDVRAVNHILEIREMAPFSSMEAIGKVPYVGPSALTKLRDAVPASDGGGSFTITPEMAEGYRQASRNWAFITNDQSPFADFFTLTLQERGDLDAFANNAINGQDIPKVYCSGLAYANLNLALNFPLNQAGLGDLYDTFQSSSYYFSDAGESYMGGQLEVSEELVGIDRLVFEPYGATDILNEWVRVYLGHLPPAVQAGLIQSDQLAESVVSGMRNLEWSDSHAEEKSQSAEWSPATIENVKRWANAFGQPREATPAYLAADEELANAAAEMGLDTSTMTPMEVVQEVEREKIDNRFVPPRIWLDEADKLDSDIVYVGTVLNCELLTSIDGSGEDACALGGAGATTFAEGAADTSTYAHYQIPNGGERNHRRFDATPGPELVGGQSYVDLRATHPNVEDFYFVLHTPEAYAPSAYSEFSMTAYDQLCTAAREASTTCAPPVADNGGTPAAQPGLMGIVLDPRTTVTEGAVDDATFRYQLDKVCSMDDEQTMTCPVAIRNEDGSVSFETQSISRASHGWWSASMIDRGGETANAELENCEQCSTGGGHFNQWVLNIRAD
jgi:DNA uptake protein ComE-like DNA-binding protein